MMMKQVAIWEPRPRAIFRTLLLKVFEHLMFSTLFVTSFMYSLAERVGDFMSSVMSWAGKIYDSIPREYSDGIWMLLSRDIVIDTVARCTVALIFVAVLYFYYWSAQRTRSKLVVWGNQLYHNCRYAWNNYQHPIVYEVEIRTNPTTGIKLESRMPDSPLRETTRPKFLTTVQNSCGEVIGMAFRWEDYLVSASHVLSNGDTIGHTRRMRYNPDNIKTYRGSEIAYFRPEPDFFSATGLKEIRTWVNPVLNLGVKIYGFDVTTRKWLESTGVLLEYKDSLDFLHTASTLPGFSGTPVLRNDRLLGVHVGSMKEDTANVVACTGSFAYSHTRALSLSANTDILPETTERDGETASEFEEDVRVAQFERQVRDQLIRRGRDVSDIDFTLLDDEYRAEQLKERVREFFDIAADLDVSRGDDVELMEYLVYSQGDNVLSKYKNTITKFNRRMEDKGQREPKVRGSRGKVKLEAFQRPSPVRQDGPKESSPPNPPACAPQQDQVTVQETPVQTPSPTPPPTPAQAVPSVQGRKRSRRKKKTKSSAPTVSTIAPPQPSGIISGLASFTDNQSRVQMKFQGETLEQAKEKVYQRWKISSNKSAIVDVDFTWKSGNQNLQMKEVWKFSLPKSEPKSSASATPPVVPTQN